MHLRKIADRFVEVSPQLSEYLARATPRQCGVAKSVASAGLDPFDVASVVRIVLLRRTDQEPPEGRRARV